MSGILYVVATPIGNLEDLAPRARQTLASVDLIAAEDTRHTGRLLSHFGIKTPQFALHEHNEREAVAPLLERLGNGQSLALVSDAGTPLISDPGRRRTRHTGPRTQRRHGGPVGIRPRNRPILFRGIPAGEASGEA